MQLVAHSDAETVMARCDLLGSCSIEAERLTRPYGTDAMGQAHAHVSAWMREAGMTAHRDNIGNLRGRYEGSAPDSPTLFLGSHLDSVRDAGKYDGPLGVVIAIAAVQRLHDHGKHLPYAIEVLAFADEEGLRFGTTYLGSRAIAGTFDAADLERVDAAGISAAEAVRASGGDPDRISDDRWRGGKLIGYCEVHIEQGPVLEASGVPVGIVSAIAAQARHRITFKGVAGHAGTVPMNGRRDALAAAAEFVLAVEADAHTHVGEVATVGQLDVRPGAANVIPGQAVLSLDVRHPDEAMRAEASQRLLERAREIAVRRRVEIDSQVLMENPSVPFSGPLTALLARAAKEVGQPDAMLPSGAGHDGVAMSAIADIAMLFVRCKGGVSHNPAESVTTADVSVALDVLGHFLELLAQA
jgi:allantoate deiminase